MADTDGEKPAYPIVTANDSTPYSVVVSDIAFDSDNSQIFYLFKELNPNKPIPVRIFLKILTFFINSFCFLLFFIDKFLFSYSNFKC